MSRTASSIAVAVVALSLFCGACAMDRSVTRIPYEPAPTAAAALPAERPVVLMPFLDERPDTLADPEKGPYLFAALAILGYSTVDPVAEEVRGMLATYLRRAGVRDVQLASSDALGERGEPAPDAALPADALVIGGVLGQFAILVPGNPHREDVRARSSAAYMLKAYVRDQKVGCVVAEETFVGLGTQIEDPGTEFVTEDNVNDELLAFTVSGLDAWFASMVGPGSPLVRGVDAGVCYTPTEGKDPVLSVPVR